MDKKQRKLLLKLARQTIENRLIFARHDLSAYDLDEFNKSGGVFVTLNKKGNLRGCIGRIESNLTIYKNVLELSNAAAFEDNRFSPVTEEELTDITIEISLLSVPEEIEGNSTVEKVRKVKPGTDGVVLSNGIRRATFLPQVWESLPILEDFIGELCRKAGRAKDYWQTNDLEISVYQVEKFGEQDI